MILNTRHRGDDGLTSWARVRGRAFNQKLVGFMEAVLDWARTFTPPEAASGAIGLIKRAVQSGADLPLESGLALERELQARLFMGRDASEGIDAFKGKRPPHFTGQ